MLWVERFSFLPDLQRDGGDLTRQRQPRHLWLHSLIQEPKAELLKDPAAGAGRGRGTLEQVLQLMVMVPVQSAHQYRPLSAFNLPVDHAICDTAARLQRYSAAPPELAT